MAFKRHTRSLIQLCRRTIGRPRIAAEVGVWRGANAACLLGYFGRLNLLLVDMWRPLGADVRYRYKSYMERHEHSFEDAFREMLVNTEPYAERRHILRTDSLSAANFVQDGLLDFVFIDGCHAYKAVLNDIQAWAPKVRPGGLICGHDYNGRGDKRRLFGVKPAVDRMFGDRVHVAPGSIWWVRQDGN